MPELVHYWRDPKDPDNFRSEKIKESELKLESLKSTLIISPKYISIDEKNERINEEMKVSENITKSLQEK